MTRLPVFTSRRFIRAAKKCGFVIVGGGKGSHVKLYHVESQVTLTIPNADPISVGLRHQLLKDIESVGILREVFIKLLSVGTFFFWK